MDTPAPPRKLRLITALAILVVGVLVVVGYLRSGARTANREKPSRKRVQTMRPMLQTARWDTNFVGSESCRECHAEIAETYHATHSMARASAMVGEERIVEDYNIREFSRPDQRVYQIDRRDGQVVHHELMRDAAGETIYDQAENVALVIGSGGRGRSFVLNRGGQLFQSPISWYSQQRKWDLAPGYGELSNQRFGRKLAFECVYCHVGRMSACDLGNDRFGEPVIVEGGISCERCHGPGKIHVERQRAGTAQSPDLSIVNPIRLDPERRDSVCYQCHLRTDHMFTRRGKTNADFRAGLNYNDVFISLHEASDDPRETSSVVMQFRASRCFRESTGQLGCVSCHEPHSRPAPETRAAFYREKCLKCHENRGCSLAESERMAAPASGSCIHCHMPDFPLREIPHTALVDHRILARPASARIPGQIPFHPDSLKVFASDTQEMPREEVGRARALIFAQYGAPTNNVQLAEMAISELRLIDPSRIPDLYSDDPELLHWIGIVGAMQGQATFAERCWNHALDAEPHNDKLLYMITVFALNAGKVEQALDYSERLLECSPHVVEYQRWRMRACEQAERWTDAVQAGERALELDPSEQEVRRALIAVLQRLGEDDRARQHQTILDRFPSR